jgi:hypothetical protein
VSIEQTVAEIDRLHGKLIASTAGILSSGECYRDLSRDWSVKLADAWPAISDEIKWLRRIERVFEAVESGSVHVSRVDISDLGGVTPSRWDAYDMTGKFHPATAFGRGALLTAIEAAMGKEANDAK